MTVIAEYLCSLPFYASLLQAGKINVDANQPYQDCVQSDHEAFKAEASKRTAASQEEYSRLKEKADAAEQELAKLRQKLQHIEDDNQTSAVTQASGLAKAEVSPFLESPAQTWVTLALT